MSRLRGYQQALKQGIYDAWNRGARTVIGCTATGSGKTVTMADMVRELSGRGVIMAHRSELVSQISSTLAQEGVRHNITAAKKTVKGIVNSHMDDFGRSFYDPRAAWTVASVDTIIRRHDPVADAVNWLFQDEGHHTLRDNKWGRGVGMYPKAKVLLMTATPCRADGKGLGSHADGVADALVMGPGLGDLIAQGYLTNYKVYAPTVADLDLSDVHITASGEFNQMEAARAIKRSRKIVGDVVDHYLELAPGKRAIVFAVDIEHAQTLTEAFVSRGVPSSLVTADTEDDDTDTGRRGIMRRFKSGELKVLVNVDLFGEGVDVPAVEVVIFARPTASFNLYSQMIGRMLRLFISPVLMAAWDTYTVAQRLQFIAESPKPFGILIDHVGNVRREYNVGGIKYSGLPEGFSAWTMDARRKRTKGPADDALPLRMCLSCHKAYERIEDCCPHCGAMAPEPPDRSTPELVDGNLLELDAAELARMRGEVARIDGPVLYPSGVSDIVLRSIANNHGARQRHQAELRTAIAHWAGAYTENTDSVNYRLFFHTFGIDVLSAMTLGAKDAEALTLKVQLKTPRALPPLPSLPPLPRLTT